MSLEALYQDIIIDHYKNPRGRGLLEFPLGTAFHVNPTCGDEVNLQVAAAADGGLLIGYEGTGCSISQASASVLYELVQGRQVTEAENIRRAFVELMHSQGHGEPDEAVLGDGIAFVGVAKYPARIKCALLPWMAFQDAEIKGGLMLETNSDGE
ncbi:MAG: SUF system NifU family Fe-S cluster assembly protein [Actinomycetota bacterium]|nr:SUF system NifU family Fe-S cluster assembly protein [Actinomycetota bacterium]